MFAALGSVFRAGAACCALVLSIAGQVLAGELQIALPDSCESRNEQNIRATFSTAREQTRLREQLVADLKSIRSELAGQRTWWGGDPTSNASLMTALFLRKVKTATDLTFDLAEQAATMTPATRAAACRISASKALAEKVVLRDGDNVLMAVELAQCINKTPINVLSETMDTLEKIKFFVDNVSDTIDLIEDHGNLKDEVARQTASLDRQIGQYEESNRQIRDWMEEMERELRQAIRAYCGEEDAKAAEDLQRVMDQTRAGVSTIGARHRQVMDRVDAARKQRSSALTQQMQGTLERLQQQQLMLLQQQQLRQEVQRSLTQQRPAYEHPQQVQRVQHPPRSDPKCVQPPTTTLSSGRGTRTVQECY